MIMKYKEGDKVKIIGGKGFLEKWPCAGKDCLGKTGIITKGPTQLNPSIFLNYNQYGVNFIEEWLESVEETPKPSSEPKKGDKFRVIDIPNAWNWVRTYGVYVGGILIQKDREGEYEKPDGRSGTLYFSSKSCVEPIEENQTMKGGEKIMTHEYHEGDLVEAIESCGSGSSKGDQGVIEKAFGSTKIRYRNHYTCTDLDMWKLTSCVKEGMDNIIKLTKEQELAFSKEQKALYRTGVVDSCGNINSSAFDKALLRVNYKALVAQAEADIKEAEDTAKSK